MAAPKKIKGVKKPGTNPYTTQYDVGATPDGKGGYRGVAWPAPSGGIGPHTGTPAGGYRSNPPLAPGGAAALAAWHAQRSRAATGQAINPPQPMRTIKK